MFELGLAIFVISCSGMFMFVISLGIYAFLYAQTKIKIHEEQE